MRLAMVEGRECSVDDQNALRRFRCAGTGAPEYEMEVQRYIRGLNVRDGSGQCLRLVLDVEGVPGILAFAEFGVVCETEDGHEGQYAISFIARAVSVKGRGFGGMMLDSVLRWLENDAAVYGRTPYVLTQIDPRNGCSVALFSGRGFVDEGLDEDDPMYHVWSLRFEPRRHESLYLYKAMILD